MRGAGIGISLAAALSLSTLTTQSARADGGLTAVIVAAVVTVASIKCTTTGPDKSAAESLCWMTPFGWFKQAEAKSSTGQIYIKPISKNTPVEKSKYAQTKVLTHKYAGGKTSKPKHAQAKASKRKYATASQPIVRDRLAAIF